MAATIRARALVRPYADAANAKERTAPADELAQIELEVARGALDPGSHLDAIRRRIEAMERKCLPATMAEPTEFTEQSRSDGPSAGKEAA